jgi:hypothetical protein
MNFFPVQAYHPNQFRKLKLYVRMDELTFNEDEGFGRGLVLALFLFVASLNVVLQYCVHGWLRTTFIRKNIVFLSKNIDFGGKP